MTPPTIPEARAALDALQARAADARAYDVALAALGRRPTVPAQQIAPADPAGVRPTDDATRAARFLLQTARTAAALHDKATRDLTAAQQAATRHAESHAGAKIEAARVARLVDALRRAPTLAAKAKRDRLGDLAGPVAVDVVFYEPGAQGPVCALTVNSRPWEYASRGEKVVADAMLRAAARRAASPLTKGAHHGMPALPLFVDDVGAWNGGAGPWPDLGPGVIWLVTDDCDALTVEAGPPVARWFDPNEPDPIAPANPEKP